MIKNEGSGAMTTKRKPKKQPLRKRAEHFLAQHPDALDRTSSGNLQSLIHELEVHQVELEMQNEELRIKQNELEESRNRYLDLYEFAPVGYFTFHRKGRIIEVNLTGAKLLGLPRSRVVGKPFTAFLDKDSIPLFLRHVMEVLSGGTTQTCELVIRPGSANAMRYVSLESITLGAGDDARMRAALIDTTDRKLTEDEVIRTRQELADANEGLRHLSERLLAVQEEERRRLAYEVHDSFVSSIAAIRLKLASTLANSEYNKDMEEVQKQLKAIMDAAIRIQKSLRPSAFDDLGLVAGLNSLYREFRQSNPHISVETVFRLEESEILDRVKIQVFRIAQEALNNIARHASANFTRISLTKGDSSIELVIGDNGRGFDVKKALSKEGSRRGLGLSSMKERATLSGGAFSIESAPGKGTNLRVSWPLT
jgi:two-component system, NarL family, sensor histidine kinase UhpB